MILPLLPYLKVLIPIKLITSAAESIIDNNFRDTVFEPAIGSVVYCDLAFSFAEHSGIYLGNNEIMHLNSNGEIERVSPAGFTASTTAISIYVSCDGDRPVGRSKVADRAITFEQNIQQKNYHLLFENCHNFTAACLTGDLTNGNSFLWLLKSTTGSCLGSDCWRVWENP